MLVNFVVGDENQVAICIREVVLITIVLQTMKTGNEMVFESGNEVLNKYNDILINMSGDNSSRHTSIAGSSPCAANQAVRSSLTREDFAMW
jgi:hypothetical protein